MLTTLIIIILIIGGWYRLGMEIDPNSKCLGSAWFC